MSEKKRMELLDKQFADLRLSDFRRAYTDKSREVAIVRPAPDKLEEVFQKMKKFTEEDRHIDCGACGYASCYDMATAIANNTNIRRNCIKYENKKVLEEMQKARELNEVIKQKNQELADFVDKDFGELENAISNLSAGNGQTAQEAEHIVEASAAVKEFCDGLEESFGNILDLLDLLEKNNQAITGI